MYPHIEPYSSGYVPVGNGHEIYYEQVGQVDGVPIVFLHGGPGAGTRVSQRRLFDPSRYNAILFDQRGSGRSRYQSAVAHNTTAELVGDIEIIRQRLAIDRWIVCGCSWGSALALAYAQAHPTRVERLVLQAIFLGRDKDIHWMYEVSPRAFFPHLLQSLCETVDVKSHESLVAAINAKMQIGDPDGSTAANCAALGVALSYFDVSKDRIEKSKQSTRAVAAVTLELWYWANHCFLPQPDALLLQMDKIADINGFIIHGQFDLACPPSNAYDLKRTWPRGELRIVPDAGHAWEEAANAAALVGALDEIVQLTWTKR